LRAHHRSRDETRLVEVFSPGDILADTEWIDHAHAIVRVTRDASRIRCNLGIFARLRSFIANALRFNNAHNVTDAIYRIACGGVDAILALHVMN
jgi:hypothetical protein